MFNSVNCCVSTELFSAKHYLYLNTIELQTKTSSTWQNEVIVLAYTCNEFS